MTVSHISGDMQTLIRLSKSSIGLEEKEAVTNVLNKEYLGMGDEVQKFEQLLSEYFNRSVVCVNTGTAALHLAIQCLGIGHGDEVLVPSLTYVASFQAISATGATPVACDIDLETLVVDPDDARKRLTEKTRAIMPVHYGGDVGNLDKIYEFANSKKLRVIEDAAHAFGSTYGGKKVGSFGDIACFSFDGIKNITSGEGGCVVTDDVDIIRKCKDARLLGVEQDSEKRFIGERSWDFNVSSQGWRYHMSNIMAAIGIAQLNKFSAMAAKRQKLAQYYDELLSNCKNIKIYNRNYSDIVPHIYVLSLDQCLDRAVIRDKLLERGIQSGIHYQPNHQLSYYAKANSKPLENTEKIAPHLLSMPLHCDLEFSDIKYISEQLEELAN